MGATYRARESRSQMPGPDPESRKYLAGNHKHFDKLLFDGLVNVNLRSIASKNETILYLLRCTVR